jgi:Meiotically up-regulated gene 113
LATPFRACQKGVRIAEAGRYHSAVEKGHILEEIRRTAAENAGVPFGSRKFEAEVGIRQTDWRGKYWARWGDALREAGFAANKLTQAYPKTHLLEEYAKYSRQIGRLPTSSDIRLKCRTGSGFPDDATFRRLGTKPELVRELLVFCRTTLGYEDVMLLCEAYAPAKLVPKTSEPLGALGHVYLIRSSRFYKIGRSNAIGRREYELGIQLPERSTTLHVIQTDDPLGIEAYWHKRFATKRQNGEWFKLDAADVAAFRRRTFM